MKLPVPFRPRQALNGFGDLPAIFRSQKFEIIASDERLIRAPIGSPVKVAGMHQHVARGCVPANHDALRDHDVLVTVELAVELLGELTPFIGRNAHPTHSDGRAVIDLNFFAVASSQQVEIVSVGTLTVALHQVGYGDVVKKVVQLFFWRRAAHMLQLFRCRAGHYCIFLLRIE